MFSKKGPGEQGKAWVALERVALGSAWSQGSDA